MVLSGFSVNAVQIIAEELNRQLPGNIFELSNFFADLGVDACVTLRDDDILVTNMTGLFDKFKEDGGGILCQGEEKASREL